MKKIISALLIGGLLSANFSCRKDKTQSIPAELNEYVLSFFEDARNNGLDIYLKDYELSIEFTTIDEASVDGKCNTKSHKVEIDSSSWKVKSFENKTKLIYHELGHCILERGHTNSRFPNGECKSIMRSGFQEPSCWVNFISTSWVEYYKKELFTENVDLPTWYDTGRMVKTPDSLSYNLINIDTLITDDRLQLEQLEFDENENFQMCITYYGWQVDELSAHFRWNGGNFTFSANHKVTISRNSKFYFRSETTIPLQSSTKLCIQKQNNFYFLFVDDKLVHVMDYETWENKEIHTNSFDTFMNLRFSLFNF